LVNVAKLPLGEQLQWSLRSAKKLACRFVSGRWAEGTANPGEAGASEGHRQLRRVIQGYVRRPYSGRVAIFWPVEEPVNMPDEPTLKWDQVIDKSLGWSQVVRNLEVYPAPRNSINLVTKDINVLVGHMKDCLDRAQTNRRRDKKSMSHPVANDRS
jgi:hypothetical protein